MKIHEYQGKEILKKYKVPLPKGAVADNPADAKKIAESFGNTVVVKAQIHAGGRGKGGGVKVVKNPVEAEKAAEKILGMTLVTHQTGPEGRLVKKVLVEEGMEIKKELYLGITIDRASSRPVIMASEAGGMDIEEVAANTPEKILKETIDPALGILPYQARKLVFGLNTGPDHIREMTSFIIKLYNAFKGEDCSLAEINPMVITGDNRVLALDAKISFDDNALYRHKDTVELRDLDEEEELEVEASKYNLNYIKLDGNIGCMVNGAGLAMSTMDIIKLAGGEPANFLDVGGGADAEMIENAFRILLSDKNVKGVFINIFGGILRCDTLATGIVQAAKHLNLQIPVVVRMEGTNVKEGKEILKSSGLALITENGMKNAAERIVKEVKS
ncbi:MAG: ADP-forming succinate--CoA ligase subunit beta [Nitrospinota bacterium]|jgi:succinyl-CoA synthetase beta subunit|nr:ADP-forming succinate--CoA ligase subunit beta [Nitrospinota bacterium]